MKRAMMAVMAAVVALAMGSGAKAAQEITMGRLLTEMVSLEWLTHALPAGTRMQQFSSYDRASRVVDGHTTGITLPVKGANVMTPSPTLGWWANNDFGNYLGSEQTPNGTEWVLAEAQGPGAIVRLWSANPGGRTWRIYLDGASEPVIAAPGKELLEGGVKPWGPAFSQRRNMGANLIFPIPFATSVKVTVCDKALGRRPPPMYYHVDLRLYPAGTQVRPFSWADLEALGPELERTANLLSDPDAIVSAGEAQGFEVSLAPGAEGEVFRFAGPAAITRLELEVIGQDSELASVLGQTELLMDFDGALGVRAPLGDFFGSSPGVNPMAALPLTIARTGEGARLVCRFVMPWREAATVRLKNEGPHRLSLRATAVVAARAWTDDSLYFHADWRQWDRVPTRPFHDLPVLGARGRGNFVGIEYNVRNPMEYFWWGEGDEKVWRDDDAFPSVFGTGTEDYFGYAWCFQYRKFIHAYHGVSLPTREWLIVPQAVGVPYVWEWLSNKTAHQAVVSQYRFQVLDTIPFERRLDFFMENWHHRSTQVDINATAYWYAAPGAADDGVDEDLGTREVWDAKQ
jgi:hypothetical protein